MKRRLITAALVLPVLLLFSALLARNLHFLLAGQPRLVWQPKAVLPLLLLKLWEPAAAGADQLLNRRLSKLVNELAPCRVKAVRLENPEIQWLCRLFAHLELFCPKEEPETDIPLLTGQRRRFSSRVAENETARLLNSMTSPGGFTFGNNSLQIGNTLGRCYGVTKYPAEVGYGWLVPMMSCLDAVTCLTYYHYRAGAGTGIRPDLQGRG